MHDFTRVLIMGTGPASIQLSVLLKRHMEGTTVGIAGRESVRSGPCFRALEQHDRLAVAGVQNRKHAQMEGRCRIDHVFQGYGSITGEWDTLILAVTTNAYLEVLQQAGSELLQLVKCVVLVSPTLGSNSLVRHYMDSIPGGGGTEVISFSTYLGDTRWADGEPSNHVITAAVKRKVFLGSTRGSSSNVDILNKLYEKLGIALEVMNSPLEAETRNISLYVHPALFMNEFSLDVIFRKSANKAYVYKMFPEGPITQRLIRDMLAGWKEMTSVMEKLRIPGLNLLKFMTDDNYPVRPESLSREDIDGFVQREPIHQEYLLYVRYTSLLIDPFSEPDKDGRYFDFSAVPLRHIFVNKQGDWDVPRMPKEDYYRIKIIQGIATHVQSSCPTVDKWIAAYERYILEAARALEGERLSEAFAIQSWKEDLQRICSQINMQGDT
ncbi:opine metallophore biosynthesis dehydrogenase [Paenibacillus gansuensis]|uniref:Opine metallophore biosynthesis dehydrogenase n=1 Tax=Paenibacillus gansuensis TaxID=306542 RepID=A0ABW5P8W5_9BACL